MNHKLHIRSKSLPVIELEPESKAVYIRFSAAKVAKSVDAGRQGEIVVLDLDANGDLVGVEAVGIEAYSIKKFSALVRKHTQSKIDLSPASITVPIHA